VVVALTNALDAAPEVEKNKQSEKDPDGYEYVGNIGVKERKVEKGGGGPVKEEKKKKIKFKVNPLENFATGKLDELARDRQHSLVLTSFLSPCLPTLTLNFSSLISL
jgi:hypothetical protein